MLSKNKGRLQNKNSYILGGLGLIGSSISKTFINNGSNLVILDNNKKNYEIFLKKNNLKKKDIKFEKFDCTKLDKIELNLKKIIKKNDYPDVFINASYPFTKNWGKNNFKDIKLSYFTNEINAQLNSSIWISHIIARTMLKAKIQGSVIQISSIYGNNAQDLSIYQGTKMKESLTYPVIKGAINNFTKQLASFYGNQNIRFNNIIAGGLEGPVSGEFKKQSNRFKDNYLNKVLIKRFAKPEDIAFAALFLSSDESSYITGSDLYVDGGWSAV
ncbi:MAG: hypothetical protein CMI90_05390 [Pelagibacteraceae bacterium]|nr:hypothetical protein [Pelagibacteraceae bacterium]